MPKTRDAVLVVLIVLHCLSGLAHAQDGPDFDEIKAATPLDEEASAMYEALLLGPLLGPTIGGGWGLEGDRD